MIYLIGGPPKCGKTTLAKRLSKSLDVPWISSDTLQCLIMPYMSKSDLGIKFPSSDLRGKDNDEKYGKYGAKEIIKAYRQQAKTPHKAIDMLATCEIKDGNDYIIEGYHITPKLAVTLNKKYPGHIKSVFLIKSDTDKFVSDIKKSSTPNDWIIRRTKNEETYGKIANMICEYGDTIQKEAKKYGCMIVCMDNDFENQLQIAIHLLTSKDING